MNIFIGFGSSAMSDGFIVNINSDNISLQFGKNTENESELQIINYDSSVILENAVNSVFFYIAPATTSYSGIFRLIINDNLVFKTYDIRTVFNCNSIELNTYDDVYLSNFIFSDKEFTSDCEVVIPQTTTTTSGDVVLSSDNYIITSADSSITQIISVDNLITEYGSNANVLGIGITGIPAYSCLASIGSFESSELIGSTFYKRKRFRLSTNIKDYVNDTYLLNNITLSDIKDKTYRWTAKA